MLFLWCLFARCSGEPDHRGLQARIIGGTLAPSTPWVVAFSSSQASLDPGLFCGGTILSPSHVLSAAHCFASVKPSTHKLYVFAGITNLQYTEGAQVRRVVQLETNPDEPYNSDTMAGDLVLVIVDPPFDFTAGNIGPANLPTVEASQSRDYTVFGWGLTSENGEVSQDLLSAELSYFAGCSSVSKLNRTVLIGGVETFHRASDQFCAGGAPDDHRDACRGDSGGPLMVRGTATVMGVVSWGIGCGQNPGRYTEVFQYVPFIRNSISEYHSSSVKGISLMMLLLGVACISIVVVSVTVSWALFKCTTPARPTRVTQSTTCRSRGISSE